MNKPLKIILLVLAALVLLVVGYLAYVLIDYHRLGDMDLEVDRQVLQPAETAGNITCCPITSASAPMSRITASLWTAERSPGPGPRSG